MRERLMKIILRNKTVLLNMLGAFAVKGLSLCLSLFAMPAYIRFFQNQTVLGVWFTIISVLNWISFFDLGLGNGLRNKLPKELEEKNELRIKELISTTYFTMTTLVLVLGIAGVLIIPRINWNSFFNVSAAIVKNHVLIRCVFIVYFGILLQFVLKLVTSVLYAMQKSAVVNFLSLISNACIVIALFLIPSSSMEKNLYTMATVNVVAMTLPYIGVSAWVYGKKIKKSFPNIFFFNKYDVNDIFKIGISLLWLQIVFMVVSSTNEFFISKYTSPNYVVEYQAYNKVFKTGGMLFSLALTPIWSAVTKAQANRDYSWIKKTYKLFLIASFVCFIIELAIVPILQPLMNIWLGKGAIKVSTFCGIVFACSGTIFVIHHVNTAIGNGISYFKLQMVWMTFAAVLFVPFSYLLVKLTGNWIGVIIADIIVLIPYEFLAPIFTMKKLNFEIEKNKHET